MAGAVEQMAAEHAGAGAVLHALEIAGALIGAPVALAGDEHRRHVDRAAGEQLQFGIVEALGAGAVPLQSALKSGALVFAAVDAELVVGEPPAGGDLAGGRHYRRDGLGHVLVEIHDVVGRHLRQLAGGPGSQRIGLVAAPIRALVVEIPAQKGVDALRAMPHVVIGGPGRVIPLVMLARPVELGQFIMNAGAGRARPAARRRRCRRAAPAGRRRARSSARPSGTRRGARGRTKPRRKLRNHAPRPVATSRWPSAETSPSASLTAFRMRNEPRSPS